LVLNSLLQNFDKLLNDVGFAYQSPPPLYFNKPSLIPGGLGVKDVKQIIEINADVKKYLLLI